jgi:hypothetical protein
VLNIAGFKRKPQASFGEIREMNSQMAPESAVIIPEVVVRIAGPAANGEFRILIHRCVHFVEAHAPGGLKTKKPSNIATASRFQGEHFREPTGFRASASRTCASKAP